MKKILITTAMLIALCLGGCRSTSNGVEVPGDNPVERQLNRSVLIDSAIQFELGGLPITLPSIGIGFKFHWRRPTNSEEIDLNLSKLGRWKGMSEAITKPKLASPRPPVSPSGK